MRANLSDEEKKHMKRFWLGQFGGLKGAAEGNISLKEIIECIGYGWVKEDEWIKIARMGPYQKTMRRLNGLIRTAEISPFSDDFITYFWDKLKPLMTKENISKLKKHHKRIS